MNKYLIITIVVVALGVIGWFVFAPKSNSTSSTNTSAQQSPITIALADVAAGKALLFDVRTPEEFNSGHAKNATNFDSIKVQNGEQFPADKNAIIYLYCRSGSRAGQVQSTLKSQGYTNVTNLGGLSDMQAAGAF